MDFGKEWDKALGDICGEIRMKSPDPYELELQTSIAATQTHERPRLIVLNGPAGAGKSTLGKILEGIGYKRIPRITSRPKRAGEVHGRDYHFVTADVFLEHANKGEVLAAKTTYGHHRGFLKKDFHEVAAGGLFYTEGESSLKAIYEYSKDHPLPLQLVLNIFLITPTGSEWVRRIEEQTQAGHFSDEEKRERLAEGVAYLRKSAAHLAHFPRSLYLVNDDIERVEGILAAFAQQPGASPLTQLEGRYKVGTKEYAHSHGVPHPIVIIYVLNSKGELLLQQRQDSGLWDHSAAGHLDLGETAEVAARRELGEELGFQAIPIPVYEGALTHARIPAGRLHHGYIYKTVYDGAFKLQGSEVRSVRFASLASIHAEMTSYPERFTGGFIATFETFLRKMVS